MADWLVGWLVVRDFIGDNVWHWYVGQRSFSIH